MTLLADGGEGRRRQRRGGLPSRHHRWCDDRSHACSRHGLSEVGVGLFTKTNGKGKWHGTGPSGACRRVSYARAVEGPEDSVDGDCQREDE